jgi:bifunctional UDP-N-acetylglucosamine pyrophosphorylase / glucosamine-1-phosphate N-acetyltransferase
MMTSPNTAAIVLAAGKGTRMNSTDKNKVALTLGDKPMVVHTVDHLTQAGIKNIIVVVGFQADSVRQALGDRVTYVVQKDLLGTGDAIKTALPAVPQNTDTVLAVSGDDSAFYPPKLLEDVIAKKQELAADLLVLTIKKENPTGLGRIVRSSNGNIARIVEEKVATEEEKAIQEINTGLYCFDKRFLSESINKISKNPISGEYYLTDLVEIALSEGKKVETYFENDASVWHGVNLPQDLVAAQARMHE